MTSPSSSGTPPSCSRGPDLAITVGAFAVAVLVLLVLLPGRKGWSPGYLAADLRLQRRGGERAGIGRALVRTIAWVIDILPGLPLVAYTSASLTRRHQRVGDLLARTYVVDKRAAGRPVDAPLEDIVDPVFEPETLVPPEPERGPEAIVAPAAEPEPVGVAVASPVGPAGRGAAGRAHLGPTKQALCALALRGRTLARARRLRLGPAGAGWRTRHTSDRLTG